MYKIKSERDYPSRKYTSIGRRRENRAYVARKSDITIYDDSSLARMGMIIIGSLLSGSMIVVAVAFALV